MKLNLKLRVKSETINQKYSFKDNEMKTLLKYLLNCCQLSSQLFFMTYFNVTVTTVPTVSRRLQVTTIVIRLNRYLR